jgi:hypothetical protein
MILLCMVEATRPSSPLILIAAMRNSEVEAELAML